MKTAREIYDEIGGDYNIEMFNVKQKLPYEQKVIYAKTRAEEFVAECDKRGLNYHVSVGGLDSITLLIFLRNVCHIDCPAISASHLEDKSIREIHKQLGVIGLKPIKDSEGKSYTKARVLQEFGFPVTSMFPSVAQQHQCLRKILMQRADREEKQRIRFAELLTESRMRWGRLEDSEEKEAAYQQYRFYSKEAKKKERKYIEIIEQIEALK